MNNHNGIVEMAVRSLGKGFDLTSDFRLKYCKGEERLVVLNESEKQDLMIPGFGSIKDVSIDIKSDKGDRVRYQSDILDFQQMSELFNQKSSVPGKIPSGMFNAKFGFEGGSWGADVAETKYLGIDGYVIVLFDVHIDRYPLALSENVRDAVPSSWDPCALARFIEKYGTHVVVGVGIGGEDMILVRQDITSSLGPSELKQHLNDLGDQLFTGICSLAPNSKGYINKAPKAFNVFDSEPVTFNNFAPVASKDGITVMCKKKGGDPSASSHLEWLPTVSSKPDAIHFNFIPITSLLKGVSGKGFLSHAINLYLRYKPPLSDLQYFLDFQSHKIWAPIHNDLPLGPTANMSSSSAALQFSLMGPKLHINTAPVTVGNRPVTGIRFYLEGIKANRLAIHLQHLSNIPTLLQNKIDQTPLWRTSDECNDAKFFEPVSRKKFSHVCTAPVKYNPAWNPTARDAAYIVTGAQLHIKKHDSKNVLHLRLLYSKVSNTFVSQSRWAQASSKYSQKSSGLLSALSTTIGGGTKEKPIQEVVLDSSVFPTGPPVTVQGRKLVKYVDVSHVCRGPQDSPGHWLVTAAKLDLERGKICLQVKFSLLNISSSS